MDISEEKKRIISQHFQVNMDRWATLMEPNETILTLSFPLTIDEARIMLFQNLHYIYDRRRVETDEERALLTNLKQRIGEFMLKVNENKANNENKTCFVKLSSRSPKDVTMGNYHKTNEIYERIANNEENRSLIHSLSTDISDIEKSQSGKIFSKNEQLICNERLKWLYQASAEAMKSENEEEALNLLLQSRRIYWDLLYALEFPESFDLHLIFREWRIIPLQYEFRAFVYNNQLTAISQYFTQLYFPSLSTDILLPKIKQFWERVKDRLASLFTDELVKYVIDFAIVVDQSSGLEEVVILELNPYNISTGSGLFSWEDEKDCDILEGISPLEFRLVKQPLAHTLRNKLHPGWVTVLFGES